MVKNEVWPMEGRSAYHRSPGGALDKKNDSGRLALLLLTTDLAESADSDVVSLVQTQNGIITEFKRGSWIQVLL